MKIIKLSLLLSLALLFSCSDNKTVIHFDTDQILQDRFIGHGIQWSAYPHADSKDAEWGFLMSDEKWHLLFQRLDYMKPSLVRVIDQANWRYLKGFDRQGNPVIDYESQEVRSLEKILSYCQENNISVLFGEWGCPYTVHDTKAGYSDILSGAGDPKWINMIADYLEYLILKKGYSCIRYYNLINEPNGYWASNRGNWKEWSEGIALLDARLKEKGLSDYVSIAGPDVVAHYDNPDSDYTGKGWVEAAVNQLDDHIGIYDIHAYTSFPSVRTGDFQHYYQAFSDIMKSTGKPMIFGELGFDRNSAENQAKAKADPHACEDSQMAVYDYSYGIDMADAVIQLMNAGFSGAIAWSLDDAMHTMGDEGDPARLKRWGMWNILGSEICSDPADENIRPWYYAWSLLCKVFPAGSKTIKVSIPEKDKAGTTVRATATITETDFSLAIVNHSDAVLEVEFKNPVSKELHKKCYSRESFAENPSIPDLFEESYMPDRKIKISLPAQSLTVLTSLK